VKIPCGTADTSCAPRGSLSKKERLNYIDAVYCLANKPGVTPTSEIPGARSRYDDFVGSHMQQTPFVHADGLFLGYHRYYLWQYEKALRNECGYEGAQPYWDWTLSYEDPRTSTVLDGSPYSLGSNGVFVPLSSLTAQHWYSRQAPAAGASTRGLSRPTSSSSISAPWATSPKAPVADSGTTLDVWFATSASCSASTRGPPTSRSCWTDAPILAVLTSSWMPLAVCTAPGISRWATLLWMSLPAPATPCFGCITPRSIVCGLSGRTRTPKSGPTRSGAHKPPEIVSSYFPTYTKYLEM